MLNLIRLALGVALIYTVWHNAHWSVALSITLFFAMGEVQALASRAGADRLDALSARLKAARAQYDEEENP